MMEVWNDLIENSDCPHFMFNRDFMDYHSDRFQDYSLLVKKDESVIACMPANILDDVLYSHQGLSFGGLLINKKYNRAINVKDIIRTIIEFAYQHGVSKLIYKFVPSIYHLRPSCADYYALRLYSVCNEVCHLSSTLVLLNELRLNSLRKRNIKKAIRNNLCTIIDSHRWDDYWEILKNRLLDKHNTYPVHTINEIKSLNKKFPEKLKLSVVIDDSSEVVAGIVMFESCRVAHAQYIAIASSSEKMGALDILFSELLNYYRENYFMYFDFGISTEDDGGYLNEGLCSFKEGFGATSTLTHTFEVDIRRSLQEC